MQLIPILSIVTSWKHRNR